MKKSLSLLLLIIILTTATSSAETFQIDPIHTRINFSIKHLVILTAHGNFREFSGSIQADPENRILTKTRATILAASVNTNLEKRDKFLRSKDFLDVDRYPEINFKSKKITGNGNNITIIGDLTIKEISKEITLTGCFLEISQGKLKASFTATGMITRDDFGLNQKTSTKVMLGNEIQIDLKVESIAQPLPGN